MARQDRRPLSGTAIWGESFRTDGIRFAVWSGSAERIWVSIFDADGNREIDRLELSRAKAAVFCAASFRA